jgi:integrase
MQTALMDYLEFKRLRIGPNYFRDLKTVLEAWNRDFDNATLNVTTAQLQAWADAKRETVKPATVAAYLFAIGKYYDWASGFEPGLENPALAVFVPKHHKPFRKNFVSFQTVKMLISECQDQELRYCLFCGFHAGLRFGEVVASRPDWFDLNQGVLYVTRSAEWDTKNHDDRAIPLTLDFKAFLRVYGLRMPYMIAPHKKPGGKHRYRFDFSRRFETYVATKNVEMTFHDARRTFSSLHASAGTSIFKIARWLGDRVDVVERHYAHLLPSDEEINKPFHA